MSQPQEALLYKHHSLQNGLGQEIRLIILLPGQLDDPVVCAISHVLLSEAKHDAVSYTWATDAGNDSVRKRIWIETKHMMHVTMNCERALRELRHPNPRRQL